MASEQYHERVLSPEDLENLTGCRQPSAQQRILKRHNIPHIVRSDGRLSVCWHHIYHPNAEANGVDGIDWSAI